LKPKPLSLEVLDYYHWRYLWFVNFGLFWLIIRTFQLVFLVECFSLTKNQPVGVWTREGPKLTSEFVMRAPYSGWWCKENTRGFILVRAKEGPTSSGERRVLYFLAPKCLCRGYKPW
jgi:hypothetical protein